MILDSREIPDGATLSADLCVIGAGAVGITLALALAEAGREVLLLEAGGETPVDPALHSPLHEYRERRLGGSTTIWGGRCLPFDPIDFERRAWIGDSGWPIDRAALDAYYPRANRLCEAGAFAYTTEAAFARPLQPMIARFAGDAFTDDTLERFSCPTDFGRRYRAKLTGMPGVRLLLHANVVDLALAHDGGRVERVEVATLGTDGRRFSVAPRQVVLAAGGLETARLLLASNGVHAAGIGNAHDVVGRYYQSHIAGTIGAFTPTGGAASVWNGYDVADDGTYCRRRLALGEAAQRRHRVGAFVARLHHPRIGDPAHRSGPLSALHLGRALVPRQFRKRLDPQAGGTVRHLANAMREAPAVARFGWNMAVRRRLAARKYPSVVVQPPGGVFSLDVHAEQLPNRASRVTLARDDRDALGMPRLVADWRYLPEDVATVRTGLTLLAEDLVRSGSGTLIWDDTTVEAEMLRDGAYPGHHIGTARMGDDPATSVVDRHCRVHGVGNLHVVGAAVFPTSSQANPTLTAVALALRLADRLGREG
jgi:choline dehydrogenase-like flavoprotein